MKKVPAFKSDAEAEAFLDQDLSNLDFGQFKPMRFEVARKEASLNMRLPAVLLEAVQAKARASGVPCARYVRMLLEKDLARPTPKRAGTPRAKGLETPASRRG